MRKILKRIAFGIPILLLAGLIFVVVSSYLEHQQLIEQEQVA
jgi:MFS superfamily sulfate permease-like transporter